MELEKLKEIIADVLNVEVNDITDGHNICR